jgi:phage terminase large subunit GpA-like protein
MRDSLSRLSYHESISQSFKRAFAPWSRMTPEDWAEMIYRLPNGSKFQFSYCPYVRTMFLSLFDRSVTETIFQLYSRGLKSTAVLLAMGYMIDQAPRRMLVSWPTQGQAEKWSKDNLCGELLDCTPPLQYLGSAAKKRTGTNTMLHKHFPGGMLNIIGCNAGEARRSKASLIYNEEIDSTTTETTDEGDIYAIISKRGDEYPDTIRVSASYPALKLLDSNGQPMNGHSRINAKLLRSDENQWHSTCVACGGEPFVMHPGQIIYEKENTAEARFQCPRCKALLNDQQRYSMVHRQGFDNWKPSRPFRGIRGFQGNAMLWPHPTDPVKMPGGALQMIAQQEVDAEKSDNPKRSRRTLVNMVWGEPFDPVDESETPPDWKLIYDRREDYEKCPMRAAFLSCFVDVQRDRLEVEWDAWDRHEESWGMDHVVLDGYTSHPEVWAALLRELQRKFPHESGASLSLGQGFIDGGKYAEDVYRFFQRLAKNPIEGINGKFFASKGYGKFGMPVITRKVSTVAGNLKGNAIGTWDAKDKIYERLRMKEHGAGFMHFNQKFGEQYCRQLVVEKVAIEYDGGQEIRKYENKGNERNEALDLRVGSLAALRRVMRNWDHLEAKVAEEAEALKAGTPVVEQEWDNHFAGKGFNL